MGYAVIMKDLQFIGENRKGQVTPNNYFKGKLLEGSAPVSSWGTTFENKTKVTSVSYASGQEASVKQYFYELSGTPQHVSIDSITGTITVEQGWTGGNVTITYGGKIVTLNIPAYEGGTVTRDNELTINSFTYSLNGTTATPTLHYTLIWDNEDFMDTNATVSYAWVSGNTTGDQVNSSNGQVTLNQTTSGRNITVQATVTKGTLTKTANAVIQYGGTAETVSSVVVDTASYNGLSPVTPTYTITTNYGTKTTGGTTAYSIVSGGSYATINAATGVLSKVDESDTNDHQVTVRVTVSYGGKSGYKDVVVTIPGAEIQVPVVESINNLRLVASGTPNVYNLEVDVTPSSLQDSADISYTLPETEGATLTGNTINVEPYVFRSDVYTNPQYNWAIPHLVSENKIVEVSANLADNTEINTSTSLVIPTYTTSFTETPLTLNAVTQSGCTGFDAKGTYGASYKIVTTGSSALTKECILYSDNPTTKTENTFTIPQGTTKIEFEIEVDNIVSVGDTSGYLYIILSEHIPPTATLTSTNSGNNYWCRLDTDFADGTITGNGYRHYFSGYHCNQITPSIVDGKLKGYFSIDLTSFPITNAAFSSNTYFTSTATTLNGTTTTKTVTPAVAQAFVDAISKTQLADVLSTGSKTMYLYVRSRGGSFKSNSVCTVKYKFS